MRRPRPTPMAAGLLLLAMLAAPPAAQSAEITLSHAALERVVWQVLLTDGGRGYLVGGPGDTCRFAFVQEPKVKGAGGRLQVRFLFSGRAGAQAGGQCVGPGDTFDLVVSGVPALSRGELYFEGLRVDAPDTRYFRLVRGVVESGLRQRLRFPLKATLDQVAAAMGASAGYAMSVDNLQMSNVRIGDDALRFSLDLALTIR